MKSKSASDLGIGLRPGAYVCDHFGAQFEVLNGPKEARCFQYFPEAVPVALLRSHHGYELGVGTVVSTPFGYIAIVEDRRHDLGEVQSLPLWKRLPSR